MAKMTQVGVAWKKTTQNSKEFVSIVITNPTGPDIRLSMWANGYKEKDGQPDFILYKSADERPAQPAARKDTDFPSDTPSDNDEIPF